MGRRGMLLSLAGGAALLVVVLALGAAALWWGQERLLFHPTPLPPDHRFSLPADVHETTIDVPGARLHALHLRLPQPDGLVFYLHGNAGNLASWFVNLDFWRGLNVDLFMVDYRGYGKSTGRIASQAELLADVQAAWQAVAPAYAGRPVVLAGRSLGTGLAAHLAAHLAADLPADLTATRPAAQRPAALLLVSPYTSLQALAAQHYPLAPGALLRYPLRTDAALQTLAAAPGPKPAVVLLHGTQDALIPPAHSDALAALLPGARAQHVAGAGHSDLQDFEPYLAAVRSAVRAAVAPGAPR
jgi:pimeloyl-ACP methyl ester carboxylesterase